MVGHAGYCYRGLEDGEDGPHPAREEAEVVLIEHLRAARAATQAREG